MTNRCCAVNGRKPGEAVQAHEFRRPLDKLLPRCRSAKACRVARKLGLPNGFTGLHRRLRSTCLMARRLDIVERYRRADGRGRPLPACLERQKARAHESAKNQRHRIPGSVGGVRRQAIRPGRHSAGNRRWRQAIRPERRCEKGGHERRMRHTEKQAALAVVLVACLFGSALANDAGKTAP